MARHSRMRLTDEQIDELDTFRMRAQTPATCLNATLILMSDAVRSKASIAEAPVAFAPSQHPQQHPSNRRANSCEAVRHGAAMQPKQAARAMPEKPMLMRAIATA